MKIKEYTVDAQFRNGKNGRKLFFPYGSRGRGYIIPSDEEYRRLRRGATLWYILGVLFVIIAGVAVFRYFGHTAGDLLRGYCLYLLLLTFLTVCLYAWYWRQWTAMEETDEPYSNDMGR